MMFWTGQYLVGLLDDILLFVVDNSCAIHIDYRTNVVLFLLLIFLQLIYLEIMETFARVVLQSRPLVS